MKSKLNSLLQASLLLLPLHRLTGRSTFVHSTSSRTLHQQQPRLLLTRQWNCHMTQWDQPGLRNRIPRSHSTMTPKLHAKPKRGSVVESYRTITVNCNNCGQKLFRYKKKNGTKSNLVKMYVERIVQDCTGLLSAYDTETGMAITAAADLETIAWNCPSCQTNFARPAIIHGQPALKLIGGKIRMTRK